MSAKTLEIIRNLAQAAANSYDGALDENGNPIQLGLKREAGNPINDSRVIDGFKVKFEGPLLVIKYQTECKLSEIYGSNYEDKIEGVFGDIVKFLKKEYRKIAGRAVSLSPVGEADILVQEISRIRISTTAHKRYKIGGMESVKDPEKLLENRFESKFRNFLQS